MPVRRRGRRLRELIDALAALDIEQDTEAQEAPTSITAIWNLLASPHVANAPHGENVEKEYFARMISADLWIPHGKTYKGVAIYFPKLVCDGDMGDIYGEECDVGEPTLPDVANMDALGRYAGRNARWDNAFIIRGFE